MTDMLSVLSTPWTKPLTCQRAARAAVRVTTWEKKRAYALLLLLLLPVGVGISGDGGNGDGGNGDGDGCTWDV